MESAVAVQAKGRAWGLYCATKVSIWRTKSFTWRNDPRRIARGATDVHGPSSPSFLPMHMKISPVAEYIKLFTGLYTSIVSQQNVDKGVPVWRGWNRRWPSRRRAGRGGCSARRKFRYGGRDLSPGG